MGMQPQYSDLSGPWRQSLRFLGFAAAPTDTHSVLIHKLATQIGGKKGGWHCQDRTDGHIGRVGNKACVGPPHPPVVRSAEDGDIVYQRVKDARLCFLGAQTIAFEDGLKLQGASENGRDSGEEGEDCRVVGERGEEGSRYGDVECFESCCNGSGRRGSHRSQVQGIENTGEEGEGNGEVNGCWMFRVAVHVNKGDGEVFHSTLTFQT